MPYNLIPCVLVARWHIQDIACILGDEILSYKLFLPIVVVIQEATNFKAFEQTIRCEGTKPVISTYPWIVLNIDDFPVPHSPSVTLEKKISAPANTSPSV